MPIDRLHASLLLDDALDGSARFVALEMQGD